MTIVHHSSNKDLEISITDQALQHFKHKMQQETKALGIQLSVKKAGCSGMTYWIDYLLKPTTAKEERFIEQTYVHTTIKGVPLYITKEHYEAIYKGVEIDFITEQLGQTRLDIKNPNIKNECGCKESFNV